MRGCVNRRHIFTLKLKLFDVCLVCPITISNCLTLRCITAAVLTDCDFLGIAVTPTTYSWPTCFNRGNSAPPATFINAADCYQCRRLQWHIFFRVRCPRGEGEVKWLGEVGKFIVSWRTMSSWWCTSDIINSYSFSPSYSTYIGLFWHTHCMMKVHRVFKIMRIRVLISLKNKWLQDKIVSVPTSLE